MRLYGELASWWPLLSPAADYAAEAAAYERCLVEACPPPAETLLELGSGGGNNASFLKARFRATLVDPSPGMLAASRALNPECEHLSGDMRSVRLGRTFDCVFIHDAVCYMTSLADLRLAVETAFVHTRPGGAALLAPDFTRETFRPGTDHGGSDAGVRGLRFLEWAWDPDPADTTYTVDYAYLLREADGTVRAEHDRHIEGLFSRDEWLGVLGAAGFEATVVPIDLPDMEGGYEVFVARRPA